MGRIIPVLSLLENTPTSKVAATNENEAKGHRMTVKLLSFVFGANKLTFNGGFGSPAGFQAASRCRKDEPASAGGGLPCRLQL